MTNSNEEKHRHPVLMIGLDAAEFSLIEQMMAEGRLPNLAALQARGVQGSLRSTAYWLVGSPWPSFYCSNAAEQFGMYHYLVWRPELMRAERPDPTWMPLEPFWRRLPELGRDVIAIDVPLCYAPDDYGGVEISGWATHELLQQPGSAPPDLLVDVRREFGRAPFDEEGAHRLTFAEFMGVRDQCVETAYRVGELGCSLMNRKPWDLALVCFSSPHRGGHLLWDRTILKGNASDVELESVDCALQDVYVACDGAIGKLVAAAGDDAAVVVFSLHGMGPNNDRTSLLPEMLTCVLDNRRSEAEPVRQKRITERLRELLPTEFRARVKRLLPMSIQDRLTLYWRENHLDWSDTKAFMAFCDLDGYIRINLRGRERNGLVEADEYRPLCEQIAEGLRTFRDADTGEPLVSEIGFAEDLFPEGPMRHHLPDIIVRWNPSSAAAHRRIVSDRYGSIDWPTPGVHPLARAGNHRRDGFLVAAGPEFEHAALPGDANIMDLAPTVLDILGLPERPDFRGKSLLKRTA
jgi:predicted AlkP superfamily phosphohydrolase/phosphomutase